jgi:hypothetical protein
MKKCLLSISLLMTTVLGYSQVSQVSVTTGKGYANQVWYNLETGQEYSAPRNNWDLAFSVGASRSSSIHINSSAGINLWVYPKGKTDAWNSLDTTGISKWKPLYNSEYSWDIGAFDQTKVTSNQFDYGWGVYNMNNHQVVGDSLYVIQLQDKSFKKLWIVNLNYGTFNFKYASLDGSDEKTTAVTQSDYSGKNFVYYSISNNKIEDREPLSANWDLTFTTYTAFIPVPYTVSGVLSNTGLETAQTDGVNNSFTNYDETQFSDSINQLGYDWKSYSGSGYIVNEERVYFLKKQNIVWKLVFTGFEGSGTGKYSFTKEKILTTSIFSANKNSKHNLTVYPNPTSSSDVLKIKSQATGQGRIINLQGQVLETFQVLQNNQTTDVQVNNLPKGIYTLLFEEVSGNISTEKLIIQ